jgi:hypothetical protein
MTAELRHDRSAWERVTEGPRFFLQCRSYKHLIEFRRPCKTCGESFSIFVTQKIADERADSNSFGLVNCELHRRGRIPKPDVYAAERELRAEVEKLLAENERLKNNQRKMPWEA